MPPRARFDEVALVDAAAAALAAERDALELEQAVRGLDSYAELALHPVLARGLDAAGYAVHREERYPQDRGHRRRSQGRRCDLVLTPAGTALSDGGEAAQVELFPRPPPTLPGDAYWLEVKAVAQFVETRPNRAWAAATARPVFGDVEKLCQDPGIGQAGLLMVLFSASREVAVHDLGVWAHRALDRGLEFSAPAVRHLDLVDRWGNSVCTVALLGVLRGAATSWPSSRSIP